MGDISPHLSRSEVACPCGCGKSAIDYELVTNIEMLCDEFLEEEPEAIRVALHVNSGNRCAPYDRSMKIKNGYEIKEKPSEHINNRGLDFWLEYVYPDRREKISDDKIQERLMQRYVGRHGIGRYKNRTHYDTRTNGPARWDNRA